MSTAQTLIVNKYSKAREITWANPRIWLEKGESRAVEGLYPSQCATVADRTNFWEEVGSGMVDVTLITTLATVNPKTLQPQAGDVKAHAESLATDPFDVQPRTDAEKRRQRAAAERELREREYQQKLALEKAGLELSALKPTGKADEKIVIKVDDPFKQGRINSILPQAEVMGGNAEDAPPSIPAPTAMFKDDIPAVQLKAELDKTIVMPEEVIEQLPGAASLPDKGPAAALPALSKQAEIQAAKHRLTAADLARIKPTGRDGKLLGTDIEDFVHASKR